MRKLVATLALVLGTAYHANSAAFYVIKLKNGNELVTGRYWQDGQQIMFDTYGDVLGIEEEFINTKEASTRPATVERSLPKVAERAHQRAGTGATQKREQTDKGTAPIRPGADADPILKEFYGLKDRFPALNRMLTSELNDFARDLTNFKKKARQSEKVNDYNRQLAEANVMEDEVSSELRSRGQ